MYTQIKSALKTLLDGSSLFQQVYDYEPASLEAFPCATISAQASQSSDLATGTLMGPTQLDTYTFGIRIYYAMTKAEDDQLNDARQTAEAVILEKTDALIDLLGANRTLGGTCQKIKPVATTIGETQREQVVKYADVTVQVDVVVKRI